jgi:hypothetical protein
MSNASFERDKEKMRKLWQDHTRWIVVFMMAVAENLPWQVGEIADSLLTNADNIGHMFDETPARRGRLPNGLNGRLLARAIKEFDEASIHLVKNIAAIYAALGPKKPNEDPAELLFGLLSTSPLTSPFMPETANAKEERQLNNGNRRLKPTYNENSSFYAIWKLYATANGIAQLFAPHLPPRAQQWLVGILESHAQLMITVAVYYHRKEGKQWTQYADLLNDTVHLVADALSGALPREVSTAAPAAVERSRGEWKAGSEPI